MLRKAGHQVSFFDSMLADGIEEYDRLLQAGNPQLVLFYEDNFNFLSKMCLGTMRRAACEMIASARRAGRQGHRGGSRCHRRSEPLPQGRRGSSH